MLDKVNCDIGGHEVRWSVLTVPLIRNQLLLCILRRLDVLDLRFDS